jgi:hypothetical protein
MSIFLGNKYCRVLVVVCKTHSTQIGLSRRIELGMPFTSKKELEVLNLCGRVLVYLLLVSFRSQRFSEIDIVSFLKMQVCQENQKIWLPVSTLQCKSNPRQQKHL